MKITVMTADEQIVTLEVDRDESVIHSFPCYIYKKPPLYPKLFEYVFWGIVLCGERTLLIIY